MTDPYTILAAFVRAYHGDPIADSDLDDEQPKTITVTLGDIRRAQRVIDAQGRAADDARRLAGDAIHEYRLLQNKLWSEHHTFAKESLDALAYAMQAAFGSARRQEDIAITAAQERAK